MTTFREKRGFYVYLLRDCQDEFLYIGYSWNPYARVRQHLAKSWGKEIKRVSIIRYYNSYEMRVSECELIARFEPKYVSDFELDRARRNPYLLSDDPIDTFAFLNPETKASA